MKRRTLLFKILIVVIAFGITFGIYSQVKAQQGVVSYLEDRLLQQNVPVLGIKITQDFPLQLEVTLQSMSDGKIGVPEDPIYLQQLDREIVLAGQQGYFIERYSRITVNKQGEQIAKSESRVKLMDQFFLDVSPSKINDSVTTSKVDEGINLYGMTATNLDITSENGMQLLTIQLSTPSITEANRILPIFMHSLQPSIEGINSQGAHIVVCKVELKDASGKMLLNYILDLQLRSERWWIDEKLTTSWFLVPIPAP